ncbi:Na+/H+ antiporter [Minicystis rosea]|nr:Na+/H+ antiporter [Minicystis rosea]
MSMQGQLERLLTVLATGAGAAIFAKRIAVPYNVALVVVGLLLVLMDVLPKTPMDPQVILFAFLPVLVFEGALFADADGLLRARRPVLALAVPGVAISLLGTAAVATMALGLSFSAALLLGALLSITDTVSVLLAFRSVAVPHRLVAIMEGESLFNDGTALVLVSLATVVVARGTFDGVEVMRAFALAMIGGMLVGGAAGALGALVLRRTPDHLTAILASGVLVLATSLLAERVHASPVMAVVVAGLVVGRAARAHLEPSRVLALQGFWETAGFGLNVILFLLVGMQLDARTLLHEAASIGLALVALHAGRAVAVYGCFAVLRALTGERVPVRWQHVMVIGNIKGALSMAAVLALPADLPSRARLVTIVFGVTLVTLVCQALPFQRVLRALQVTVAASNAAFDAAKATLISARRGLAELDELLDAGLVSRSDHARRRAAFHRQVIEAEEVLRTPGGTSERDRAADVALILAQKAAVIDAARRGLVGATAAEERIAAFDRALMDLSHHEEGNH